MSDMKKFTEERESLNELVMKYSDLEIKRFFHWIHKCTGKEACLLSIKN